jgi:hypothetical protein
MTPPSPNCLVESPLNLAPVVTMPNRHFCLGRCAQLACAYAPTPPPPPVPPPSNPRAPVVPPTVNTQVLKLGCAPEPCPHSPYPTPHPFPSRVRRSAALSAEENPVRGKPAAQSLSSTARAYSRASALGGGPAPRPPRPPPPCGSWPPWPSATVCCPNEICLLLIMLPPPFGVGTPQTAAGRQSP